MTRHPTRWALLLLLVPLRLAALQGPALETVREGLELSHLPPVLGEAEVRKQLGTGLTTSFLFETTAKGGTGGKVRGAARVDVRYELWDEVYIVTRIDATGRAVRTTLPSFERLVDWWRNARLVVIRPPAAPGARRLEVRLRVIPFSQAEQLDAQRWFSQALSAEKSGSAGAVSEAVENQPESFSQVINLLLATSIGRAALLEYQWTLAIPPGRKK
ncbi:MAG TPA: hypothetical protein VGX68_17840 [Thermoanaerobaculia bacterium]|jgi:hypothetical protein|nr:hypothetical protein [Thermoanaerobaculia bacterium]